MCYNWSDSDNSLLKEEEEEEKMKTTGFRAFTIGGLLLAFAATSLPILAQDPLLEETEDILQNDQLDVDGTFAQKRKSAADKIEEMRRKLEERNEEMVQKKIEDVRIKEEMKLTKRLQDAFNSGLGAMDENQEVSVQQAAPAPVATPVPIPEPVVVAPLPEVEKLVRSVTIAPKFGILNVSGEGIDFDSKFSGGLDVSALVGGGRVAIGMSINYSTLNIKQYDKNSYNGWNNTPTTWGYDPNVWNSMYSWYGQNYNNGMRDLSYNHLAIGANAKVYLAVESKVKPYIGVGFILNRASLKYDESKEMTYNYDGGYGYNPYSAKFGDEAYKATYLSGAVGMGIEVMFNDNLGMVADVNYSRGLTSGSSESSASYQYNADQAQLDKIGKAIEDSSFLSIGGGVVVSF